jgi:hypothetical protein
MPGRTIGGMSVHFRSWPRCINMQAEQPVTSAIGPAQRLPTRRRSLAPAHTQPPICSACERELSVVVAVHDGVFGLSV